MKQKILYILLMITALLGGNGEAWAWGEQESYVLNDGNEYTLGESATGDKIPLSGPGSKLTFEAYKTMATAVGSLEVQQSSDASNWSSLLVIKVGELDKNSYKSFSVTMSENVRYIRFKTNGSSYKRKYKNIKVTRATTLATSQQEINWGDVQLGEERSQSITVTYNNTTYNQELTAECTNNSFILDNNRWEIGATGEVPFNVSFTATKVGAQKGSVVLKRGGVKVAEVPVSANVVGKYTPTFNFSLTSANPNHIYNLGEFFSTDSPNAYTITSDDETKAKIIGNKLYVLAQSGDFYLTVLQEESEQWYPKTDQYKVSVVAGNSATHAEKIDSFSIFQGGEKTINFTFPTKSISYSVEKQDLAADYGVAVSLSIDHGVSWNSIGKDENITTNVQNFTKSIPQNSTHIKFERLWDGIWGPTLSLYYTNVYCHMASYMTPSQTSVACGRTMVGNTSEVQNITIDWSDVDKYSDNLKVMCDNPNFSVSVVNNPCTPANQTWGTSNQRWGQSTISVTYTPKEEGNHPGNIYFYDNKRFITIPVSGEAYKPLILSPNTNPNTQITDGGVLYSKVQLNRALPQGHFTATFPFDYNISVIPKAFVAQLELVTHNQQDGYTLYFKKVADGQMLANQPYVVYLPEAINNPEWADVIIMKPEEGSVSSDKTKGWTMRANYTPGVPMEGMYGIAEGKLRKGIAGARINAYTAYFIPPTANPRVRMAVLDDDGGVTYIDDVREDGDATGEAEQIYRLDGTKHATLTKGINIVKMANGEVRKVLK